MKLVLFDENFKLGLIKGSDVVDVSQATQGLRYFSPQEMMNLLIENFDKYRGHIEDLGAKGNTLPLSQVRLRSPLPEPIHIVCMAGNYMESGTLSEPGPISAFNKSSSSVIGNGDTVVLPDAPATVFEHEAELGIVIGKRATAITADQAYDHIFGYLNFIDVSCRGIGRPGADNFFIGKSWHTFGPMGPALVTADEVVNPQGLPVRLSVQGELRQDYNTSDMAHKIPEMLEWITSVTTLEPGDVIACGTNHRGLGPLQDGDKVEMEIGNFGQLTVHVTDAQKRVWPRETHAQREAREAGTTSGS